MAVMGATVVEAAHPIQDLSAVVAVVEEVEEEARAGLFVSHITLLTKPCPL